METKDWLDLLAILMSPLIAVMVTIWMQDRREKRARMYWVFATVVANRHQKVDPTVVQALNSIDVVFSKHKEIRALWAQYLDITEQDLTQQHSWKKMDDKYVELTHAMAKVLGYGGTVSQLDMGKVYSPIGLGNQATQGQDLLTHALRVFKGEQPLVVASWVPEMSAANQEPDQTMVRAPDEDRT